MPDKMLVTKRSASGASQIRELQVERSAGPNFQSLYINNVQMNVSFFDVKLLMGEVTAASEEGVKVTDKVAIMMSPEHAASLHSLLGSQLDLYRKSFGPIRTQPSGQKPR